jgi:hypothetical protein
MTSRADKGEGVMMRNRVVSAAMVLTMLVAVAPATAMTLGDVIAEHVKARGGEKWEAVNTMKISGSFTAFSETHPFAVQRKRDHKYYMDVVVLGSPRVIGFDGDLAWSMSGDDPSLVDGLDRKVLMRDVDFATPLFDYEARGFKATLLGEVEFDGMTTIGVELVRPDESVETWYLDPKTYLERGLISPGTDYLGETPRTTFFEDFRDVQGLKIPFYVESQWLTRSRVTQIDEIVTNLEVDDALFVMPPPAGMGLLAPLVGTWTVAVARRRGPDDEWQESERESTISATLRGGLLEERFNMGDGAAVIRTLSYDKFNKRYRVTQIDGRRNQMNVQEGEKDVDGRVVVSNLETGTSWSGRGTTYHSRMAIFDITDEGFKMEHETSTDGGESWFLGARATYARQAE